MSSIGFGCVNPLIAFSARDLGANVSVAAFMVSLLALGAWLGNIPAGALAARIGEKKAIITACLVDAVVMMAIFAARTLPMLAVGTFMCGLTSSMFGIARQSFLTEAVPFHARGRALSTLGGVFRIGHFIGPLAGAAITHAYGLRYAYAFASAMSLLAALITFVLPDVEHEAERLGATGRGPSTWQVAKSTRHALLTVGIGGLAIAAVRSSRATLVPLWCNVHGLEPATTSLIVAASMACDVLLFLPGGWMMDRAGRFWLCVPSVLAMSMFILLLPHATTTGPITAVAMGLGIGNGLSSGILMTLAADNSPAVGRTKFIGLFRVLTGSGDAGAPLVISAVTGVATLGIAATGMGIFGLLGAAWLSRWIPRTRPPARTAEA